MATQMQLARAGKITDAMKIVAENEHIDVEKIRDGVQFARISITKI